MRVALIVCCLGLLTACQQKADTPPTPKTTAQAVSFALSSTAP